jgi:hypothetical protein
MIVILIFIGLAVTSCSSMGRATGASSKKCGCGLNKGFTGY